MIKYDGKISIAVGRNRKETSWKNKTLPWADFVGKLSTTHRTAETHAEYLAFKKPLQDERKDVGGFVGGYLTGGRRKANSVAHRQLITLDIDFAKEGFWADFTDLYDSAAVMYSTHKHCPTNQRLRLVIPLNREVLCDEYVAIARKIAGNMGIDLFDHTTFEPSRLMYWPSTAKDGEYLFEMQDGPWLDADEILRSYRDWSDSSEWPVSDKQHSVVHSAIKKQGDPTAKPGVVGAFCRTYSIEEAIDMFLGDVYERCDTPGRYTFLEGSTAGGLVVYEDMYTFSHHGTDPSSGKLCNAFDLVRLHMFGLRDSDAKEGTPGNKMPSYSAMLDFCSKDAKVRTMLVNERMSEAADAFAGVEDAAEIEDAEYAPASDEWKAQLDVDRKGNIYNTLDNMLLILEHDPALKGRILFDEFAQEAVFKKSPLWRRVQHHTRYLTDTDEHHIEHHMEKVYGINTTRLAKSLSVYCGKHGFHPVKAYLETVRWDNVKRLDKLLVEYMGAADTPYTHAVTRKTLTAAVARIYEPGIKFDYMLTLVGKQGLKKSTLLRKLGKDWFSDSLNLNMLSKGKDGFEQLRGTWLLEIQELAGMHKTDVNLIKSFITSQEDRYRVAYTRHAQTFPRQCVLFGSVNDFTFLRDTTGNRRFWPIDVWAQPATKDVENLLPYEVELIWAEAVALYKAGEKLYLDKELEAAANEVQGEHAEMDERTQLVANYLEMLVPETWGETDMWGRRAFLANPVDGTQPINAVCVAQLWEEVFKKSTAEMTTVNTKFIHLAMQVMPGWALSRVPQDISGYGKQRVYYRQVAKVAEPVAAKSADSTIAKIFEDFI